MTDKVEGEEAMEMFKLVVQNRLLPAEIDDLVPMSFIGQAAVRFYQTKIKLMDQLGMTEVQRKATLRDGQDAGDMLLEIEARIGELLPSREDAQKAARATGSHRMAIPKGTAKILPEGITHKKAYQARTIKDNPEVVAKIKAQARENEDIPTKTAVLNAVHAERGKKVRAALAKSRGELALDQQKAISALEQCIRIIPREWPRDWREDAFDVARGYARILIKRLEVFNGSESKS